MTDPAIARASNLVGAGLADEAITVIGSVLAAAPRDPVALQLMTRAQLQVGRLGPALDAARLAVMADPRSAEPLLLLAEVLTRRGESWQAKTVARRAVGMEPGNWRTHHTLSYVMLNSGSDTGETVDAAREAVRLAPDEPLAHQALGIAADRMGYRKLAITELREALRLDPTDAGSMRRLSRLRERRGRLIGATRLRFASGRADPHHRSQLAWFDGQLTRLLLVPQLLLVVTVVAVAVGASSLTLLLLPVVSAVVAGFVRFSFGGRTAQIARHLVARETRIRTWIALQLGTYAVLCLDVLVPGVESAQRGQLAVLIGLGVLGSSGIALDRADLLARQRPRG